MMEKLMNLVFIVHYTNWFFSEVLGVIDVVYIPVLVCCVIGANFSESGVQS